MNPDSINRPLGWPDDDISDAYAVGQDNGKASVRDQLAARLTDLSKTNIARNNSAYMQALNDLGDAMGVKTRTEIVFYA